MPIYPDFLDRSALLELPRGLLQYIAKKEGIKANEKSTSIIRQLLAEYQAGYPKTRFSVKKPQINYVPSQSDSSNSDSSAPESSSSESSSSESSSDADVTLRKSKRQRIDASPRRDLQAPRLLTTPLRTPSREAEWAEMVANAGAGSPDIGSVILQSQYSHRSQPATPPPPPTLKDARYVRRETTRHVNDAVIMRAELGEIKDILEHTVSIHRNAMAEYREMSVLRREVEISIFQRMKNERDLWDGTGNMAEQDREPWEQLLKESEEFKVERKKEARRKEFEEWMAKEGANRENEARQVRLAAQAREATDDTPEGSTGSKRKRPVAVDEEE